VQNENIPVITTIIIRSRVRDFLGIRDWFVLG